MRCHHALILVGALSCASAAHAQLAIVPQGDNVWSRGLVACDVVWQDDETAPPSAVQYDLVFDPAEVRVARVDRGVQALLSTFSGPRDIDARVEIIEPGRARVIAAPPLSTSPILHSLVIDVLAGGGENVTISIENFTAIGPVGEDFPVLSATFPAAQFTIAQDAAPLSQALPPGGLAVREGSFLTVTPRADKSNIGLTGRIAFSAEPGILQPITINYTGVTDVPPLSEWNAGAEADVLSILFTSSLTPSAAGGYPLPLARFQVIGAGPANTTLTIATSDLHSGAPGFQSIADSLVQIPFAILPAQSALVKLDGPSSSNWEINQQVELVASLDIPAGSTPGLVRALFETNPDHLRIDSIALEEGAPWFAELFATSPAEVALTGQATAMLMLDSEGVAEDTAPSPGGYVPVFRIAVTVLDPDADAAILFTLADATERSPWGEDLVLQAGPPSSWSLIPPPTAISDLFSIQ